MYKNRVYLASPFFSPEQKARIEKVVAALKQNPTIDPDGIYNPQEHQEESLEFGSRDWQDSVFNTDMRQVKRADVVVAITDYKYEEGNYEPDSGTIFEIETSCGGSELLYDKMTRLIKAETVKTPGDKEMTERYNSGSNLFVGRSLQEE